MPQEQLSPEQAAALESAKQELQQIRADINRYQGMKSSSNVRHRLNNLRRRERELASIADPQSLQSPSFLRRAAQILGGPFLQPAVLDKIGQKLKESGIGEKIKEYGGQALSKAGEVLLGKEAQQTPISHLTPEQQAYMNRLLELIPPELIQKELGRIEERREISPVEQIFGERGSTALGGYLGSQLAALNAPRYQFSTADQGQGITPVISSVLGGLLAPTVQRGGQQGLQFLRNYLSGGQ